jgi:hypothetical protein
VSKIGKIKAIDALFIQAGIAAALSFSHIHDLAEAAGQGPWQAWSYPISVDLLLFAAWRRIRAGKGGRVEWFWFAVALVASLGANLATAGLIDTMPMQLKLVISGWPAAAFLGGTLLVHGKGKATEEKPVEPPVTVVEVPAPTVPIEGIWTDVTGLESLREPSTPDTFEPGPVVKDEKPAPDVPPTDMDPEKVIKEGWRYGIDYKKVAAQVGKHPTTIYRRYQKLDEKHGKPAALAV